MGLPFQAESILDLAENPANNTIELKARARAHFDARRWDKAAALYRKIERLGGLSPVENACLGVSFVNLDKTDEAMDRFDDRSLTMPAVRRIVRQRAVVTQIRRKNPAVAEAVLRRLLDVAPEDAAGLALLSTLMLREGRGPEAMACLLRAFALEPDNGKLRRRVIRTQLRLGNVEAAGRFALKEKHRWWTDPRFAHLSAMALLRLGQPAQALAAAEAICLDEDSDAEAMATAAEVFLEAAQPQKVLDVGRTALRRKGETAQIRFLMARASLQKGDDTCIAMHHLRRCRALAPDHLSATELLADLMMREGVFRSAADHLQSALRIDPANVIGRHKLGEALRFQRRHQEAARVQADALSREPRPRNWKRRAIAALLRAGRVAEAQAAFDDFRRAKTEMLPPSLRAGLKLLEDRSGDAAVSTEALNWAWRVTLELTEGRKHPDRTAWERLARWGHLADALVTDWLECLPDEDHELAELFKGLDAVGNELGTMLADGRGAIIVTAHLGPMYAGLAALHRLGIRHKWLGSVPHISPLARDNALISLCEQTSVDVSIAFNKALANGFVVVVAPDGPQDPSSAAVKFHGQDIPYCGLAARVAHAGRARSLFAMPYWRGTHIEFLLRPMPGPQGEEPLAMFEERWIGAYLGHLKSAFALGPRSLRMTGGLWMNLR